jgi:hypothetical protein
MGQAFAGCSPASAVAGQALTGTTRPKSILEKGEFEPGRCGSAHIGAQLDALQLFPVWKLLPRMVENDLGWKGFPMKGYLFGVSPDLALSFPLGITIHG